MNSIKDFKGLVARFAAMENRKTVALVCPDDESTEAVIERCLKDRLALLRLVTSGKPTPFIEKVAADHPDDVTVTVADSPDAAAEAAVAMVRDGSADVVMKGSINTDNLLRAVLNKEHGLLPEGNVMSHITVVEAPAYDKLLMFSDAAVIPQPTLDQLDAMVRYDSEVCRRLGITQPKIALIHFTEKVNKKFPVTLDYQELMRRADAGLYGDVKIGGPMDIKTACDAHSAEMKHIDSPVTGRTDIAIFPNLWAANTFYKSVAFFGRATMAGIISGTSAPVVVPSRADSADSKFYSLALACVVAD